MQNIDYIPLGGTKMIQEANSNIVHMNWGIRFIIIIN